MRRLAIALLLIAATLLTGCGTAYYGMPPRTLQEGETSCGVGIAWNSLEPWADWHGMSLNGNVWWAYSDHDAMGVTFSHIDFPLFVPEVSYARSWAPDADGRRVVASVHASLAWRWNPVLEAGVGISDDQGEFAHLAWAGAGLWPSGAVTPSLRYVAQHGELRGEVGYMPGRTATALRVAKGSYFSLRGTTSVELTRDDVIAFEPKGDADDPEWTILRRSGSSIQIRSRDPYVDMASATWDRGFVEKFPPEPGSRLWWVYLRGDPALDRHEWFPIEEDLAQLAYRFEREGVLRLAHDQARIEQAVQRYDQWWRDLAVGVWWAWYDAEGLE